MPLYEYRCEACGKRFEVIRKYSDPVLDTCTHCGSGPVVRLQSSPAIQFKGTGWYVTDYAQKGKSGEESSAERKSDEKKNDEKKSDAGSRDAATTAKTDSGKADSAKTGSAAPSAPPKPSSSES